MPAQKRPNARDGAAPACCSLEAVVGVDDRGQLVLPKDLRIRAGIEAGERLALVSYRGEDGGICCLALVKASKAASAVRSVIEPLISSLDQEEDSR